MMKTPIGQNLKAVGLEVMIQQHPQTQVTKKGLKPPIYNAENFIDQKNNLEMKIYTTPSQLGRSLSSFKNGESDYNSHKKQRNSRKSIEKVHLDLCEELYPIKNQQQLILILINLET